MNYLFNVFSADIFSAMHPMVTYTAQSNEVVQVKTQGRITCPGLDVMGAQAARSSMGRTTADAMVIVPFIDCPDDFFPFTRRVQTLTFWRTAIGIVGVCFARSARHAVGLATQAPVFTFANSRHIAAGYTKFSEMLEDVCLSASTFLSNITGRALAFNVFALKPFFILMRLGWAVASAGFAGRCYIPSPLARWDAIADKPFINLFRIATNQFSNAVSTQSFDKIFLSKPCLVNRLLRFLPLAFASERTEAPSPLPATNDFSTAVLTI